MKKSLKPNISMGNRLYNFLKIKFPEHSHSAISREFGFPNSTVITWEDNKSPIPPDAMIRLMELGCNVEWLLTGLGNMLKNADETLRDALDRLSAPPDSRRMKVRRREDVHWWESDIQPWEVRGTGAANAYAGTVGDDLGYAVDSVEPPIGLTLVEADGESMSPVIMDGQYAMIDKKREGFEINGGIYVLVIVSEDGETEVRIKRCYRVGDEYDCCSVDSKNHPAFRAKVSMCRVWPVIGVWFADKGRPPMRG